MREQKKGIKRELVAYALILIFINFQLPGKKATSVAGWVIQAKVQVYLWLGLTKHKKDFLTGLPGGYDQSSLMQIANKPHGVPLSFIHFTGKIFIEVFFTIF